MAYNTMMDIIGVSKALNIAGNTSVIIPASYYITAITVQNTTANALLGLLRIGTTAGATDVFAGIGVLAGALFIIDGNSLLKRIFSMTSDQTLYISSNLGWNSANINLVFQLRKSVPSLLV